MRSLQYNETADMERLIIGHQKIVCDTGKKSVWQTLNTDHFKFILHPVLKNDVISETTLLYTFVISEPSHYEHRRLIRSGWLNKAKFPVLQTVFILGLSFNPEINTLVRQESELHNDIVQANFMDTYLNLTLKTMVGMKWVSLDIIKNRKQVNYVMKLDENVIVNSKSLIEFLNKTARNDKATLQRKMICHKIRKAPVQRDPSDKFGVSKDEYPNDRYPIYCAGPAYIMSSDVPNEIYNLTLQKQTRLFNYEDVFVGMQAKRLGLGFYNLVSKHVDLTIDPLSIPESDAINTFKNSFFIHLQGNLSISRCWNLYSNSI